MPQNSFALLTNTGRAKEAAALASGVPVVITHIVIGDGATVPSGGETELYNEVARKSISASGTVAGAANVAYFDAFLPAEEGPYTIREAGLLDETGALIAIAHYDPPINKPVPASGQTVEGTVRLEVAFSNIANVSIVVDASMQVALQRLTVTPWLPVLSVSTTAPPANPETGDTYVIPAGATGAWAGQANRLTEYTNAGWAIVTPDNGHGVGLPDGRVFVRVGGAYVEKLALDQQAGKWTYCVAGGTASALTAALAPTPAQWPDGMIIRLLVAARNLGAATLDFGAGPVPILKSGGEPLQPGDLTPGIVSLVRRGLSWRLMQTANSAIAQMPLGNLTFYIRHDGNDANDGLANTPNGAWKTMQGAVDNISKRYGSNRYSATVNMAASVVAYAGFSAFRTPMRIVFAGVAGTPDAVTIAGAVAGGLLHAAYFCDIGLKDVTIDNTGAAPAYGALAGVLSTITLDNIVWGAAATHLIVAAGNGAAITMIGSHSVAAGSRGSFARAQNGGLVSRQAAVSIAFTGASDFTDAFVSCQSGQVYLPSLTFTNAGVVTGKRYDSTIAGVIDTNGGGANYFPGDVAGTATTGSYY